MPSHVLSSSAMFSASSFTVPNVWFGLRYAV